MQIHEITLIQEGLGDIAKTIGSDIKSAVTAPFQKAKAVLDTPGAMTSARGYGDAMDKYYQGQVAKNQVGIDQQQSAQLAQQTQNRAKQLAQQWLQQVQAKKPTGPIRAAPSTPTPIKPTGKYATNKNAGQVINPTPAGILPEAAAGGPTPAELAKYQQKVAAASKPKTGFNALPGSNPPAGNPIKAPVQPQKNIMTGNRANEFKAWVDQQLTSQVTGTNQQISMDQVRKDPETLKKLNALLPTIIMKNDPAAIEQYLTIAMTTMQKLSSQIKQQQKASGTVAPTGKTVTVLSKVLNSNQIDNLKKMAQDPATAYQIKTALGLR
jgi:hypothetical protein